MSAGMKRLFAEETTRWFLSAFGKPTAVQEAGWPVIADGKNVLISAPTGTGKTLTAFLMLIDRLNRLAGEGCLEERLYGIYVSPLKALGNDISENLKRPIDGIGAHLRISIRNGDTTPGERQKMLRHPPHILITTPESLYLLLTSSGGRKMLSTAETVILDEIHAILGSKRGTHLLLSLARLDRLCGRPLQRIGLSATVHPAELAADFLAGPDTAVVAPPAEKQSEIFVFSAAKDMTALREHSIWPEICREIYEAAQVERTVLVFCEGRATAEKVAFGVNALGGDGFARTHHGSMAKEKRLEAERALKSGELKVLCATSSMELGIDVGEVDLVIQVGCPQRISAAIQRLGRAGHRPGEVSRMRFYPRMRSELLLAAMTAEGMRRAAIEKLDPPVLCMDVLAQHLVSMAAAESFSVQDALDMLRSCTPYRALTEEQLTSVLRMLAGDDEHEADRPVSPRIEYDRIHGRISGNNYSKLLALSSGGTIPDRGMYAVYLEDGTTRLGELDEEFVFEARLGDKFLLGAFAWRIVSIERDRVLVRAANSEGAQSPFWRGDGIGRDYETGRMFGRMLREMEEAHHQGRILPVLQEKTGSRVAAENIAAYLHEQIESNGCLATDETLVMEYFEDPSGEHQMMLHCPYGGRVNQALAVLLRAEAARRTASGDIHVWYDDDGVLVRVTGEAVPEGLIEGLNPAEIEKTIRKELPYAAQFTISFRYNMYRALMMGVRPGGRVPLWVQRIRGAEALSRACAHPFHPILLETVNDCMDRSMDIDSLILLLKDISYGRIRLVVRCNADQRPSPMSLSLRRQVEAEEMYNYAPVPKAVGALQVGMAAEAAVSPKAEYLDRAAYGVKTPDCAQKLHEKLMIEGDLTAEETEAPYEWMNTLLSDERVLYIEPGLWIAAEQREIYHRATELAEDEALSAILRRCLRYRGAQTVCELAERYVLSEDRIEDVLVRLVDQGSVIVQGERYVHAEVFGRAQRMTIEAGRSLVQTASEADYAAFLPEWQKESGSPAERLKASLRRLYGLYLPMENWESVVLPARTTAYRPQMLDDLLSVGEAIWRISGDGGRLAFFPSDAVDWEAEIPVHDSSPEAGRLRDVLMRRGASFAYALSAALPELPVRDMLRRMALTGDVVCDSMAPLRRSAPASGTKQRVRARLAGSDGGRWELARPIREDTIEEKMRRAFDRWGVLCRETAAGEDFSFADALKILRRMEYTGQVRRGYFVRNLSGAQFVRAEDFERIQARLLEKSDRCVCLNAADPAQAWGKILKTTNRQEEGFLCVPGTVVVLRGGKPALILERQGSVLRAPDGGEDAYKELVSAFRSGRIYPHLRFLTIKTWPPEAADLLEKAGFIREMRDYVLGKTP